MKKILFLLTVITLILSLTACRIGNGGGGGSSSGDGSGDTGSSGNGGGDIGSDPSEVYTLVTPKGKDGYSLAAAFGELTGKSVVTSEAPTADGKNQIIIGEYNAPISRHAYRRLEALVDTESGIDDDYQKWILYCKDGSMCLAYSSDIAYVFALESISELCASGAEIKNGIIFSDGFSLRDRVNEIRKAHQEASAAKVSEEYGEELGNAVSRLLSLFDEETYLWLADLYDFEIGGFYFSNSARDYLGFLPDIESTKQALSLLSSQGAFEEYGGDQGKAVPKGMQEQILSFVTALQSPTDGYFYHPQWKDNTPATRRSRDLKWAREMISSFGGKFLYDTPLGDKGINGLPGNSQSSSELVSPFGSSAVTAVSKVVATAALPDHLKSLKAFKNYVEVELDLRYNSYEDGNKLNAMTSEIKAAGKEYVDYLIKYLNSINNPKNGSFEADDSDSNTYALANGVMKLYGVYFEFGEIMPYYEKSIELCMKATLLDGGENNITAHYNAWLPIRQILTTLAKKNPQEAERIRSKVINQAPALVNSTVNKLMKYRMSDGSFTYSVHNIINTANGVPAACAAVAEGSINATGLASGAVSGALVTLGLGSIKPYCAYDRYLFLWEIEQLGTLVKKGFDSEPAEIYTFDEKPERDVERKYGIVTSYGTDEIINVITDDDTVDDEYKWFDAEIVQNPTSTAKDMVLRTETFLDVGAEKEKAEVAQITSVAMPIRNDPTINCYVYEADMYFDKGSSIVGQLTFSSSRKGGSPTLSLNIEQFNFGKKSFIRIGENYTGLDGIKNNSVVSGIPMDEWVRLRVEAYKISANKSESGKFEIKAKIYVNGEYAGECDAGYTGESTKVYYSNPVNYANYAHYRHSASVTYFNNITADAIFKDYVPNEKPRYEGLPVSDNYDFEDGEIPIALTTNIKSDGGRAEITATDDTHKNALSVYTNNGNSDSLRLDLMNVETKTMNFYESDLNFNFKHKEDSSEGTDDVISFSLYKASALIARVDFTNRGKYVGLSVYDPDGAHSYTVAKSGEWFTFRAEFYRIKGVCYIRYYVDGILVHQFDFTSKFTYAGTTYSANLGFDNMRISSVKNCEGLFLFDNMKMLHGDKVYRKEDTERPAVEVEIESNPPRYNDFTDVDVYPFDGDTLPSHISGSLTSDGASLTVSNGELSFYSNNGTSDSLTVNISPSDQGNAVRHAVFEADLYIDFDYAGDSAAGSENYLRISLMRGSASAGWLMLTKSADGKVALVDYSIGSKTEMKSQRLTIAEQRTVFNFRLEYSYSAEVSGENILKIFVDDQLVHIARWTEEFRIPVSQSSTCSRNVWFNKVVFNTTNATEMLLKMDNERLYITSKAYIPGEVAIGTPVVDESTDTGSESGSGSGSGTVTPSEPSEPDTPDASEGLNDGTVFDGTVYGDSTKNVYTVGYEGTSIPSAITQSLSSTDAKTAISNGVLEFYTNNGASDYIQVGILEPSVANNRAYTFQTDICISDWASDEAGATSGNNDLLELDFRNGSDTTWLLGLKRDGSSIQFVDYSSGSYKTSPAIATVGEQFNLRLEWTYGSRSGSYNNNVMKIFVDNKLVFIANSGNLKVNNKMVIWSRINITNVRITADKNTELNVKLDNTRLYSSDKAFVENEIPAFVYDESNNIVENPNK